MRTTAVLREEEKKNRPLLRTECTKGPALPLEEASRWEGFTSALFTYSTHLGIQLNQNYRE